MNKLVCLFALVCCVTFAACRVEESFPYVEGVEYPSYYPYHLKSIFNPLLRKSLLHGYRYPYYKGMIHQYGSQIPYEGVYPSLYPYTKEIPYQPHGMDLPWTFYQHPYYQYKKSIWAPWYKWKSSFYTPSYSSLMNPYHVQSTYPTTWPISYPIEYPTEYPIEV